MQLQPFEKEVLQDVDLHLVTYNPGDVKKYRLADIGDDYFGPGQPSATFLTSAEVHAAIRGIIIGVNYCNALQESGR